MCSLIQLMLLLLFLFILVQLLLVSHQSSPDSVVSLRLILVACLALSSSLVVVVVVVHRINLLLVHCLLWLAGSRGRPVRLPTPTPSPFVSLLFPSTKASAYRGRTRRQGRLLGKELPKALLDGLSLTRVSPHRGDRSAWCGS